MKKNLLTVLSLAILLIATACGDAKKDDKNAGNQAKAKTANAAAELPNYRYVDIDTVFLKYNLAKDFDEEMMRMQANYESEAKRHESSIRSFANTMQNKYQNNQYNETSYNADQQKMQQMQTNAASAMDKLQRNMMTTDSIAKKNVMDSIENFIKSYNASHHYDAIFLKQTTLYINPDLDITDEVVEGLNARYNKVKK